MGFARTQIGTVQFGRYRLTERLGAGGMAVVYRGFFDGPQGFKRSVVIKRMLPELSKDPSFVKMLLAEARLSALLHHPGIVQVYELGEVTGEYFLAMEHVDGHDLAQVLRHCAKGGFSPPPGLCCYILHELAGALAYAHGLSDEEGRHLGIVHRDISPSNVMVTKLGAVKLLDFGIAKAASCVRDEMTRTGTLKGKLAYMSPEQIDGRPLDHRSDIFALGIMLHEILTMRRLFRGDDDLHTLRLVREANVQPPSAIRNGLDPEIDAVVMKMLARDPAARYQSCDEVAAALAPIVHRHHADAQGLKAFLQQIGDVPHKPQPLGEQPKQESTFAEPLSDEELVPDGAHAGDVTTGSSLSRGSGELQPVKTDFLPPEQGRHRNRRILAAVSASVISAVLFWVLAGPQTHAPEPLPPPRPVQAAVAPPPPPPAPARPATVRLGVKGKRGAEVLVDGKLVGTVPLDIELPSLQGSREVQARMKGFEPWSEIVDADRDTTLHIALAKLAVEKPAAPKAPKKRSSSGDLTIQDPFSN